MLRIEQSVGMCVKSCFFDYCESMQMLCRSFTAAHLDAALMDGQRPEADSLPMPDALNYIL